MGTPSYMPPEQAAGRRRDIDRRSDVYSLGAILYDLLTARPPFRADNPLDTLRQVIDAEPASPCLLNPKVPRDLETICLKCLQKDPAQRYKSAGELADDLECFLQRKPINARPVSIFGRTWRWYRRNPVIGTLAGFAILMGLLQGVSALVLRNAMLESNDRSAQFVANYLGRHLDDLASPLRLAATNAELAAAVASPDSNAVFEVLTLLGRGFQPNEGVVENWVAMTMDGRLLARSPQVPASRSDRSARDYYLKALSLINRPPGEVAYSDLYHSDDDGKFKFGGSILIRNPEGVPLSVLTLMVNTGGAEERLGAPVIGEGISVLAPADKSDKKLVPGGYYEFLKPGLGNGESPPGPVNIRKLQARPYYCYWPLEPNPGHKMIGTAQIRNTPYIVVIKTDPLLWPWFLFEAYATFVILAGLALVARAVWRRTRPQEASL